MSIQEITSMKSDQEPPIPVEGQYVPWQIVGIWLAAGAPMWLLGWLFYPALSFGLPAMEAGSLRMKLMALGLVWQFILSMIVVHYEEGNLRLETIGRRFWLNHPVSARTGETKKALWWWIIPLALLITALGIGLRTALIDVWTGIFPLLAEPEGYDMSALFAPELRSMWVGEWDLLGLFFVLSLFNTFLGEEFLFRGVLLPKMEGVFGKWDWVANGMIYGFYHLHQPWNIPSSILSGLLYAFSAKHFRSTWFSIILHLGRSVYLLFLILGLVLGLE